MKVLIAEDDIVSRLLLENILREWDYEVVATADGQAAWDVLAAPDALCLAILDWQMPGLDGLELCRRVRATPATESVYVLLLTGKGGTENIVLGLRAGANDYLTKPFDIDELSARLGVGRRVVELQKHLAERVAELERTLAQVKRLQGLIPICAWCKKVRGDRDYWQQVEEYIGQHSEARFSHGICPACLAEHAGDPMSETPSDSGATGSPPVMAALDQSVR